MYKRKQITKAFSQIGCGVRKTEYNKFLELSYFKKKRMCKIKIERLCKK